MWKSVFLLLFTSLLQFHSIQESSIKSKLEALKKVTPRIVNGTRAVLGQFPHQVSLRRSPGGDHFCGGSILTPKWVLSAAHCVADENGIIIRPRELWVMAGDIRVESNDKIQAVSIVNHITIHEDFNYRRLHNDVSILGLEIPICFNNRIHSLPLARAPTPANAMCQVSGWGHQKYMPQSKTSLVHKKKVDCTFDETHLSLSICGFGLSASKYIKISGCLIKSTDFFLVFRCNCHSNYGGPISENLLYVDLPIVDISVCKRLLEEYITVPDTGVMCAGYMEGGRDACQGDSGGGMVCSGLLTGIVSGGLGCASPKLPGLYADIHVYTDWIEKTVNLFEEVKFCSGASSLESSLLVLVTAVLLHVNRRA